MNYRKPEIVVLGDASKIIQGSKHFPWEVVDESLIGPPFELED